MARAADEHNPAHGLRLIMTAIDHGGRGQHQGRAGGARERPPVCTHYHADEAAVGMVASIRMSTHPDAVLQQLKQGAGTRTVHNLERIHEVCRAIHQAGIDSGKASEPRSENDWLGAFPTLRIER